MSLFYIDLKKLYTSCNMQYEISGLNFFFFFFGAVLLISSQYWRIFASLFALGRLQSQKSQEVLLRKGFLFVKRKAKARWIFLSSGNSNKTGWIYFLVAAQTVKSSANNLQYPRLHIFPHPQKTTVSPNCRCFRFLIFFIRLYSLLQTCGLAASW